MTNKNANIQELPPVEVGREDGATADTPSHAAETHDHAQSGRARGGYLAALALGALGVVYGDIGTSPLYARREAFHGPHAIPVTPLNIYGVLSLVFWSLLIVITSSTSASSARPCSMATG